MSNNQPITKENFIKRLVDLCLRSGLSGFPKDELNQQVLFKSAILTLNKTDIFTGQEVAGKLKYWLEEICRLKDIDYITLRRMLVDAGYLTRNNDGSCYQVANPRLEFFEETIDQLDINEVLKNAREEIARRKREYLEKANKNQKV